MRKMRCDDVIAVESINVTNGAIMKSCVAICEERVQQASQRSVFTSPEVITDFQIRSGLLVGA